MVGMFYWYVMFMLYVGLGISNNFGFLCFVK